MVAVIRLGFHMSISGGVEYAPAAALEKGYGCFQLFVSNPRSWKSKPLRRQSVEAFAEITSRSGMIAFAHMPYLCNLSSPSGSVYSKSKRMLGENMARCDALGIKYLVIHLGSHLGRGHGYGKERISEALGPALEGEGRVEVLLENSAGYTNSMGSSPEELGELIKGVGSTRLGLCIDTCHAFAAGYDFNDGGAARLARALSKQAGAGRVKLIHLNDAKYPAGSGRDRHWHIGKGRIGASGFLELLKEPLFRRGPFIMETPADSEADESSNLAEAKRLISEAVPGAFG